MENVLKKCPFCGKRPIIHRSVYHERYRVRCDKGCGVQTLSFVYKEQAIEAWNRRYDDDKN